MFVNKDSIIINNVSMGQYILSAKYEFNKLWATDSGRNLAGKMTGSLIGIFPKIVLTFRKLTKEELNIIAPIIDSAIQTVTYYDPSKNQNVTMTTYTGDWSIINKSIGKNSSFDCSFISNERRR